MSPIEETIDATLDANGQFRLSHQPRLPPGPVRVTIRATALGPRRGLADVIRELAAEQRSRGFPGRSVADLRGEDDAHLAEDTEGGHPQVTLGGVLTCSRSICLRTS